MRELQETQVIYSNDHWELLNSLRKSAIKMMKPLVEAHIRCIVYGSIARGDVSTTSDIDVYIPTPPSPTLIETTLETVDLQFIKREIIQATPSYAAKAYIYLDELRSYSFPLIPIRLDEEDFTGFAGKVDYNQISKNKRVPGVNKDLLLIEPNEQGHIETYIEGMEGIVAKKLGISTKIVYQRVRVLKRREKVGRTGVYIKRQLAPDESFGSVFNDLTKTDSAIRRRLRKKN